jgi:hypothetical protein
MWLAFPLLQQGGKISWTCLQYSPYTRKVDYRMEWIVNCQCFQNMADPTYVYSNSRRVKKRSLLKMLYIGFHGSLMSSIDNLFFELVKAWSVSAHAPTT